MSESIDIRPMDRKIVEAILVESLPAGASVWVFGSRARPPAKKTADLDLLIDIGRACTFKESLALEDAFEESDLPYHVDVVDMHAVQGLFLETILKERVALQIGG